MWSEEACSQAYTETVIANRLLIMRSELLLASILWIQKSSDLIPVIASFGVKGEKSKWFYLTILHSRLNLSFNLHDSLCGCLTLQPLLPPSYYHPQEECRHSICLKRQKEPSGNESVNTRMKSHMWTHVCFVLPCFSISYDIDWPCFV